MPIFRNNEYTHFATVLQLKHEADYGKALGSHGLGLFINGSDNTVVEVQKGGLADKRLTKRIRPGDVILSVHGMPTEGTLVAELLLKCAELSSVEMKIARPTTRSRKSLPIIAQDLTVSKDQAASWLSRASREESSPIQGTTSEDQSSPGHRRVQSAPVDFAKAVAIARLQTALDGCFDADGDLVIDNEPADCDDLILDL